MKKNILLLSLVGSLALPAFTHADVPETKAKNADKAASRRVAAVQPAPARQKMIYYITDTPRTGSAIPMVYRKYNGRLDSASAAAVYGESELGRTGSIDVASELSKLDPSITIRGHR